MNWGIIALTRGGLALAERIREGIPSSTIYTLPKWSRKDCGLIVDSIASFTGKIFKKHDIIIFITAAGIAVRAIADHLEDKRRDPGVLVIDEKGEFVISLLSGHLGGANGAARLAAEITGGVPVITTSSDVQGLPSVDMFAERYGLAITDMTKARDVTSLIVNGHRVSVENLTSMEIENPFRNNADMQDASIVSDGIIIISARKIESPPLPHVFLTPRNIIAGIGCKKGIRGQEIIEFMNEVFGKLGIFSESIKCLATIDVKKDEEGIREAGRHFGLEVIIVPTDEIKKVEAMFDASDYVREKVGVASVCEPCAYLASNRTGGMLLKKTKKNGITLALWEEIP